MPRSNTCSSNGTRIPSGDDVIVCRPSRCTRKTVAQDHGRSLGSSRTTPIPSSISAGTQDRESWPSASMSIRCDTSTVSPSTATTTSVPVRGSNRAGTLPGARPYG
jgi:hypothetical protein